MRVTALLLAALFVNGCARYEYDLIQPRALARHIGTEPATLPVDPLVYQLQSVQNHLVMQIRNPTAEPIVLLGDRSVIVDPDGQSHSLASQTIAPQSFIRLILPGWRAVYEWDDPYYGGWGGGGGGGGGVYWVHRRRGYFYGGYYGFYDEPGYVTVYDPSSVAYFPWDGETDVRMTLRYERGGRQFEHSFVFHRRKAG
jgi:hypothetical protein